MAKVVVAHHVADYDAWHPVFKEHGEVRRSHGAQGHTLNRGVEDPNFLVIATDFESVEGARAFMSDPGLPGVMERAGVDSEPSIYLVEEVESEKY